MKHLIILFALLTSSLSIWAATDVDSLQIENIEVEVEEATTPQAATTPKAIWDKANTAYINGNYNEAIELYSLIEEQGLSSEIFYFNLGNAHYKNNDIPRSILYYQKALLISPNNSDVLYNLKVAQSQIRDQIEEIPEFFLRRWSRSIATMLGCTGWSILSLVALSVLMIAVLLFLLGGAIRIRKIGFGIGLFALIIFWSSTLYALSERREILEHNKAVIMSQSISIKSSPDNSATDLFMLHSGTTVKILREIDNWYEIVIADGKTGWIESRRVEKI